MTSDRTSIQHALDKPCKACAAVIEDLGSALVQTGSAHAASIDAADSIGRLALHTCIRLLELGRFPGAKPLATWSTFVERAAHFESTLILPDEPGLDAHFFEQLPHEHLRRAQDTLRSAAGDLESEGIDDPIGTLYESSLRLRPEIDSVGQMALRPSKGSRRKVAGAFYTPTELIDHLIRFTLDPLIPKGEQAGADLRICDPAAGSGRFLLAAARHLARSATAHASTAEQQGSLRHAIMRSVYAVDRDPVAVELTRFRLWEASGFADGVPEALRRHCRLGDALVGSPVDPSLDPEAADRWCARATNDGSPCLFHWQHAFPEVFHATGGRTQPGAGFDAVVGNPPFLNQLSSATALDQRDAEVLRRWSDGAIQRYADASVAFLLRALDLIRPGGRVTLIQPLSFLASRDARAARSKLASRASLTGLWLSTQHVFPGADVLTCAPMLVAQHDDAGLVHRSEGVPPKPARSCRVTGSELQSRETWSVLAADSLGIPTVCVAQRPTLGDLAAATADFRDQYYGLDGFLVDREFASDDMYPRLITAGLIDPAECRWGRTETRVLKRRWTAPRIDRDDMERRGTLGPWMRSRLVPKLLVATQTRVIEVIADEHGRLVPSTPVLTVVPNSNEDLWRLGAALSSPVCSALALTDFGGAALTRDTIKLAARQVLTLPMPTNRDAWQIAADEFRRASVATGHADRRLHLRACGVASLDAYEVAANERDALLEWWVTRLPVRTRAG